MDTSLLVWSEFQFCWLLLPQCCSSVISTFLWYGCTSSWWFSLWDDWFFTLQQVFNSSLILRFEAFDHIIHVSLYQINPLSEWLDKATSTIILEQPFNPSETSCSRKQSLTFFLVVDSINQYSLMFMFYVPWLSNQFHQHHSVSSCPLSPDHQKSYHRTGVLEYWSSK